MSLPFDFSQGLVVVRARVWGPRGDIYLRLAVDTGATATIINTAILVAVGYDPDLSIDRIRITTGSGVELAPRLKLRKLGTLAQFRLRFPVLVHTLPPTAFVDGLLGLDFFRGRVLSLDFRKRRISVT